MLINVILIIIVIITGFILVSYNSFIRSNNRVKQRESAIDVLLNQRFELLPNLIETVKGYSKHESSTFENLSKLRSSYNNSNFSVDETNKIDKEFGRLFAIAESYPELKANTNFLDLQSNLTEIENKLNTARMRYNDAVTSFNNKVESVPSNIIAKIFGFTQKDLFKIEDSKKESIKVDFSK